MGNLVQSSLIDSQERLSINLHRCSKGTFKRQFNSDRGSEKEVTQRMEKILPGGGLSFLIAQSADSVATELARAAAAAAAGADG